MCDTLQVSRSGFYAWMNRAPSARHQRQESLTTQIRQAYHASRCLYGSPRVHAELLERGIRVCLNTVAKLMKQAQIRSKIKRRFVVRTTDSNHVYPIAANVLDRQFAAAGPGQKWCCDITYIPTDRGWLYLAAVMDLCSRKIVGWSMADHLRASLCADALKMALDRQCPQAGLLHHSDRGIQYACEEYQQLLETEGITVSMSRSGNCYDNAAMESFFKTLKVELIYQTHFAGEPEARSTIFEYIEIYYNRQRRHSAIGYQSPEAFEASLN